MAVDKNSLDKIKEIAEKARRTGVDVGLIFIPIAIAYRRESKSNSLLLFSAVDKQQFVASVGRGVKNIRLAIDAAEILSQSMNYEEGERMKTQDEMIAAAKKEAVKILLRGSDEIGQELDICMQQNQQPEREKFFTNNSESKHLETMHTTRPIR